MKKHIILTLIIAILSLGLIAQTTYTVSPGDNIQLVIDGSSAGDIIEFADGTYNLSTCLYVLKGIKLISKNGSATSIIDGGNAIRCFSINDVNAVIDGFTIQNANHSIGFGGAAEIVSGGTIKNCIIKNNHARDGGGVAITNNGLVQNCIIENNSATYGGGVRLLYGGVVRNCLISGNTSSNYGGGINIWNGNPSNDCEISNCTIVNNVGVQGSGLRTAGSCSIENTIVYNNAGDPTPGEENIQNNGGTYNNICSTSIPSGGTNCITDVPQFVGANDYHLQSTSACIDAGLNAVWMTTAYDLDGNARIFNGIVDIGCYEEGTPIPTTYVPDDNFEQALIDLGYDTAPLDDYVPTANINTVTNLDVNTKNISDLTGIEDFVALEILFCYDNQLTSLNATNNVALFSIDCHNNQLTSLDVSHNTQLVYLICQDNLINILDLTNQTILGYLYCYNNDITSLILPNNAILNYIDCSSNELSSLNLSKNTGLGALFCQNNHLSDLDVSLNTSLIGLHCNDNNLTNLIVKNANNHNFVEFDAKNNPNLTCIQVDDAAWSTTNWLNIDPIASFSEDCSSFVPDTDGDGVDDNDDDFPNDPDQAFLNKFPAAGYGSLGFEDLWPGKGDYDFNDVVVDYKFRTITNAQNKVVYIRAKFIVKATGAYYHNGFGFNLPLANTALNTDLTVTGCDLQESYIDLKGNGLEDLQSHPTIIVFDDIYNSLPHPGSGVGVNTEQWAPFVNFDTITVVMTPVQNTYEMDDFMLIDWNPFIIIDMDRGREVHLKDKLPTSLANLAILNTIEDDSDPGIGRYYVTENNLPWAINVPSSFDWPREKIDISWAYFHFMKWAESSGTTYTNWYEDNIGFRNNSNIYQLPNP